jgi:hypothetical protein
MRKWASSTSYSNEGFDDVLGGPLGLLRYASKLAMHVLRAYPFSTPYRAEAGFRHGAIALLQSECMCPVNKVSIRR